MGSDPINLIIVLAHELGVALELSYAPEELREIWPDALDALRATHKMLTERGLPPPAVVENVLMLAQPDWKPSSLDG